MAGEVAMATFSFEDLNRVKPRDDVSAPCTEGAAMFLSRAKRPLFLLHLLLNSDLFK